MGGHRKRLALDPIAEDVAVGAFEQAAERSGEFDHLRCDLAMQPRLVIHRREQADRGDDIGLILR